MYKLNTRGAETVLYQFTGEADGGWPGVSFEGSLIRNRFGNLYGTTANFGADNTGVVFKIDPAGKETVLCTFTGGEDGESPSSPLVGQGEGKFYGTTSFGGAYHPGVVFGVTTGGEEKVLYSFCSQANCADGSDPSGGLLLDDKDNLYGTTDFGGTYGAGVVFKVNPNGTGMVLYTFTGGADGGSSFGGGLISYTSGNLYGTTSGGGAYGNGVVFNLSPSGTETVLYSFTGGADGGVPRGTLISDPADSLYGTASLGGNLAGHCVGLGCGVVFKLTPE